MSYREGQLVVSREKVWVTDHLEERGPLLAHLPHSCDEWEIGGAAEVSELIADLEAALRQMIGQMKADAEAADAR